MPLGAFAFMEIYMSSSNGKPGPRVSPQLRALLNDVLSAAGVSAGRAAQMSFRDPNYSPETGGFHPVEIAVTESRNILYITDFAYVGLGPYAELVKEIDFDFQHQCFQHMGREFPLAAGKELFDLWQSNFIDYYAMGVYVVKVEEW